MGSSLVFAATLIAVSILLMVRHKFVWRDALRNELVERDREYLQRQHRRRNQASGIIGMIGLLVAGGIWVHEPIWLAVLWGGVVLLVVWMTVLAFADLLNTRRYYHQIRQEQLIEQTRLQAELERIQNRIRNDNGQSREGDGAS